MRNTGERIAGSVASLGLASLAIGVLLATVAYLMGRTNRELLLGRQAEPRTMRSIRAPPYSPVTANAATSGVDRFDRPA